jgi:hypothetical protein
MNGGSVNLVDHVIVARENHMEVMPLEVVSRPSFSPLYMG